MKNCMVGQSGGPTCAINSSLLGVYEKASETSTVYGIVNGIDGLLKNKIVNLNELFKDGEQQKLLLQTPASFLGSCRFKLKSPDNDIKTYEHIFRVFKRLEIGYFYYIGGNDSMDTVKKLSDYAKEINFDIKIMGVPKTIDNDLYGTDHTPGFGSAAKFIATSVREIAYDSAVYDTNSVTIVEIMGRNAGWLTASSVLANSGDFTCADLIYLPERLFCYKQFNEDVNRIFQTKKNIVVCVSEGIREKENKYVCEKASSGLSDIFGHKYLSGTAKVLEDYIRNTFNCKARGIELNVGQRCASHLSSATDIKESYLIGQKAVEFALEGHTSEMMIFNRISNNPYKIEISSLDISKIANLEKRVPDYLINENGNNVNKEMVEYLYPLIQGESEITYENGLPKYLKRNHNKI